MEYHSGRTQGEERASRQAESSRAEQPVPETWPEITPRFSPDTLPSNPAAHIAKLLATIPPDPFAEYAPRIERLLANTVEHLSSVFGSLENLRDRTVIDIACGARATGDGQFSVRFEPWRARLLSAMGARVIGIDVRPSIGEPYEHREVNLKRELLDSVPSDSADLVIWCGYYWLEAAHQWFGGQQEQAHVEALRQEVRRVLRPGGVLYDGTAVVERKQ